MRLVIVACVVAITSGAMALDQSKLPQGSDHLAVHGDVTGAGVRVGVIEIGGTTAAQRGIDTAVYHFAGRLIKDIDFTAAAPPLAADPPAATGIEHHGTLVADVIASSNGTHTGVAPGADIYVGWTGSSTLTTLQAAMDWYQRNDDVRIFNHSWQNGAASETAFLDWMTVQRNVLNIVAAGNSSGTLNDPGTIYNGLTVGAVDAGFQARALYSDFEAGGRAKPDLVAPGTNIDSGTLTNTGTSFAAPHVTGVSALLAEAGLAIEDDVRNRLAQRAIIMNAARKRYINLPDEFNDIVLDNAATIGTSSGGGGVTHDGDYLTATGEVRMGSSATAPQDAQWSPEAWSSPDGKKLTVTRPLDDETGTGMLDARRTMIQFNGGRQQDKVINPGGISPVGWNYTLITPDDDPHIYEFNFPITKGTFITATLVWDRPVIETDAGTVGSALGQVDVGDTYAYDVLPDFNLFIYRNDILWAESIGTLDTVEHLHFPVPLYGSQYQYSLRVDLLGAGTTSFNYALAWWTVSIPEPATAVGVLIFTLTLGLTRRMRHAA